MIKRIYLPFVYKGMRPSTTPTATKITIIALPAITDLIWLFENLGSLFNDIWMTTHKIKTSKKNWQY